MGNCLVKRLKGVVDNDNLPKYGCISIKMNRIETVTNPWQVRLPVTFTGRLSVSPGGYFALSYADLDDPEKRLTSITGAGTMLTLYFKNDDYTIYIEGKYGDINTLNLATGSSSAQTNWTFNVDELAYDDGLTLIDASYVSGVYGDIKSLAKPGITQITVIGSSITGTIMDLISCINLTQVFAPKINTFTDRPDVREFVAGQIANGRATCPDGINTYRACDFIRFGNSNVIPSVDGFATLKWTSASHITLEYTSGSANNTIVAYGATAEEIAAWEAGGKTVIVVN